MFFLSRFHYVFKHVLTNLTGQVEDVTKCKIFQNILNRVGAYVQAIHAAFQDKKFCMNTKKILHLLLLFKHCTYWKTTEQINQGLKDSKAN